MLFKVKDGKTLTKLIKGIHTRFIGGSLIELTEKEAKANAEHIVSVEPEIIEVKKTETKVNSKGNRK